MAVAFLLPLTLLVLGEIAIFILIGDAIGVWRTVALVFLSMLAGIFVLRVQGMVTLLRVRDALQRGEPPAAELFDGACLMAGGILLIVPGFLTDAVALLLLLSPIRGLLRRFIRARIGGWPGAGPRAGDARRGEAPDGRRPDRPGPVIEGEFEEVPTRPDAAPSDRPQDGDADDDEEKRR